MLIKFQVKCSLHHTQLLPVLDSSRSGKLKPTSSIIFFSFPGYPNFSIFFFLIQKKKKRNFNFHRTISSRKPPRSLAPFHRAQRLQLVLEDRVDPADRYRSFLSAGKSITVTTCNAVWHLESRRWLVGRSRVRGSAFTDPGAFVRERG